jgi:DNA (cytosine-5)-methyltransferase 1
MGILAGGKKPVQLLGEFTAVDLYCGCGGVTEGLKQSGFRIVAAVDNDLVACRTYEKNHPEVHLYAMDIKDVDPLQIRIQDLGDRDVDLLVVCAPCQPFSSLNKKKDGDERARLILEALRFAEVLKPVMIFFENVPGLARFEEILSELKAGLEMLGYHLSEPVKVDAADYGVPQRRIRCVLIATRGVSPPELPAPVTPEGLRITVRDAIGRLRPLASGEKDPDDPLHAARKHKALTVRRLARIPKNGGSRMSLPPELQLECHKDHDGHPDVYGRMAWDDVAPTLTTGCTDVTKGRFAHPEQDRAITPREAAILQTFPENYIFEGGPTQIATQIGNAVPVGLVKALAPMFQEAIRGIKEKQ